MRPELGSRNLVNRLKTVVLPAPFGPIRAWIVPRRTLRSTPRTAAKPRNSLVRPRVSRIRSDKPAPLRWGLDANGSCFQSGANLMPESSSDKDCAVQPDRAGRQGGSCERPDRPRAGRDQDRPGRARRRGRAAARYRRNPDARLDEPRGGAAYARGRARLLLVALAAGAVAQGRDLRPGAAPEGTAARLRRRRAAAPGRPAGCRLPYRAAQLFLQRLAGRAMGGNRRAADRAGAALPRRAARLAVPFSRAAGTLPRLEPAPAPRDPSGGRRNARCNPARGRRSGRSQRSAR